MVRQLGTRLPSWSAEDIALVHGSNDFYGMNHYCANFIRAKTGKPALNDVAGNLDCLLEDKNGVSIGPITQSSWLRPYAIGFRKLLKWLSERYGYPKIYVTENGTSVWGENDMELKDLLNDEFREKYFRDYIRAMADAYTLDGVNVRAYMAWSLMEYVFSVFSFFEFTLLELMCLFAVTLNGARAIRLALALPMLTITTIKRGFQRRVPRRLNTSSTG